MIIKIISSEGNEMGFANVNYSGDYTSMIKEGKPQNYLRGEPESKIRINKPFKVYVGKMGSKYVAIGSIDGKKGIIIESGKNKMDVEKNLSFSAIYSMYSPSIYFRYYRMLKGGSWSERDKLKKVV